MTAAFRAALLATAEREWKPLFRLEGWSHEADQEWVEICFVPNRTGHGRDRADCRFVAIRFSNWRWATRNDRRFRRWRLV